MPPDSWRSWFVFTKRDILGATPLQPRNYASRQPYRTISLGLCSVARSWGFSCHGVDQRWSAA